MVRPKEGLGIIEISWNVGDDFLDITISVADFNYLTDKLSKVWKYMFSHVVDLIALIKSSGLYLLFQWQLYLYSTDESGRWVYAPQILMALFPLILVCLWNLLCTLFWSYQNLWECLTSWVVQKPVLDPVYCCREVFYCTLTVRLFTFMPVSY